MSGRLQRCGFALMLARHVAALDIAVLKDGDRLSGTIQKLEAGVLYFQSRHAEAPLKIDWQQVESLSTGSTFQITRAGASPAAGQLDGVNLAEVAAIAPLAEPTPDKEKVRPWTASADFGQSYSGLSGYNQISANLETAYAGRRWESTLVTHFDYYGAAGPAGPTYQASQRFMAQRYLGGNGLFAFPYVFLGRQTRDDGRGQVRQYGGGLGWTFHRHQDRQLSLYGGAVHSVARGFRLRDNEDFTTRLDLRDDDPLWVAATVWNKEWKSKVAVNLKLFYFKPLRESGRHGMATDSSLKLPLYGPAYFTVRAYDTPEIGQSRLFSRRNLQISTGIGIEFH